MPTGTVTLLFSDIEGSTRLLTSLGQQYAEVLADHRRIVREVIAASGGLEVDTQGDAFFVVFPDADGAVRAAVRISRALAAHPWAGGSELRVRVGVHTGRPLRVEEGYVGIDVHAGARICNAAHGGQVVLSEASREALTRDPEDAVRLRPLGRHRLKDLDEPLGLFDLEIEGLPSDFPPLRSVGASNTNLPWELPELLFRDRELAAAIATFQDEAARLVALTGAGGTGKTTLGMHVARALLPDEPDGVFLIPLAPISDVALVPAAVAEALSLRERPNRTATETVTDYLAGRRCLLFLDNFEHLPGAAAFVRAVLNAAPGLRVLITSRMPTRLPGEHEFVVRPLALQSIGPSVSPAAALFARRAQSARPAFRIDESNREAVEAICSRLDGLPLAIELVAARVRLLSPVSILERLARPLDLAAGGLAVRDARQQTLRATIQWGYELLPEDQQRLLAALGAFAGPFSIEAAETVCGASLDALAALLDNSLLRSVDDDVEEPRVELLFTIRAFARERLEASGSADVVRRRHAAWCAALGRAAGPRLLDGTHEHLLARFDREQDDVRLALDWLVSTSRFEEALSLAADVAIFWDTRGELTEGRGRLEAALLAAPDAPAERRAKALFNLGRFCVQQGDCERAESALLEALAYYESTGDPRSVVLCMSHLAWAIGMLPGRGEEGVHLARQALGIARASGDAWTIAVALNNLADEDVLDDPELRYAWLSESAALRRGLGERRTLAITLANLGKVELLRHQVAAAQAAFEEAHALALTIGYAAIIATVRAQLGQLALARGDLESATTLLADAFRTAERVGDLESMTECFRGLAAVADRRGDHAESRRLSAAAKQLTATKGIVLGEPSDG